MSSYDDLLLQQELQNAGPAALPYIRRSAYLAQALDAINKSGSEIKSGGGLASNLLAQALLQFQRKRNDKKLSEAEQANRDADLASWQSIFSPQQAPTNDPMIPQGPPPQQAPPPQPPMQPTPAASSGPPPDWNAVGKQTDMMARLLMGEAGPNDAGQKAVASVVMNRAGQSGLSPGQVMQAPHQFEPLNNPRTRARLDAIPTTDPAFQRALGNLTSVINNGPTTNADHFWSPTSQAALGRQPPAWAGPGQNIGGNVFSHMGYQAPPGVAPPTPPPAPMMAQLPPGAQLASTAPQPPAPPVAPGGPGAPPPAPVPQQAPGGGNPFQTRGLDSITPEQRAMVTRLLSSNDPRDRQRGQAMMQELLKAAASPIEWKETTVNGVPVFYNPQNPQQTYVGGIPQQARDSVVTGQEAGIPSAPQGTYFTRSPTGGVQQAYQPPQGYQAGPGGQQSYIPGGPNDPTVGQNRLSGLKDMRGEVKPILDLATALKTHISAVRTGYQNQNGPGDIAMVNGLQKLIDEGVVREGDVNLQLQAQGINGGIAGLVSFLTSSGKFDANIRSQLLKAAEGLYGSMNQTYRDRALGYRGIVERTYGPGSFNDVVPPETVNALGWGDTPAPGPASPGQPRVRTYNPRTGKIE